MRIHWHRTSIAIIGTMLASCVMATVPPVPETVVAMPGHADLIQGPPPPRPVPAPEPPPRIVVEPERPATSMHPTDAETFPGTGRDRDGGALPTVPIEDLPPVSDTDLRGSRPSAATEQQTIVDDVAARLESLKAGDRERRLARKIVCDLLHELEGEAIDTAADDWDARFQERMNQERAKGTTFIAAVLQGRLNDLAIQLAGLLYWEFNSAFGKACAD